MFGTLFAAGAVVLNFVLDLAIVVLNTFVGMVALVRHSLVSTGREPEEIVGLE